MERRGAGAARQKRKREKKNPQAPLPIEEESFPLYAGFLSEFCIFKMMEAAMQAAEAAMQEAAAREMQQRQANGGGDSSSMSRMAQKVAEQHMMDLEASQASLAMDSGENAQVQQQLNLLRALQAAERGDHGGGGSGSGAGGIPPHIIQEMSMFGVDPNDPESMQAILHMMAQQELEHARPEEHYLTIAQNGTSQRKTTADSGFEINLPELTLLFPCLRH